jgi:hypothetical protein
VEATRSALRGLATALLLVVPALLAAPAGGADAPPGLPETTPPRLSFVDGPASFWRPGAPDWAPARVNTPLAAGDALYAGDGANLEIQIGPRAFVRAAEKTQLGIVNVEPDFVQVKVSGGQASLDVRALAPGHTVELDTPGAVFTIEHPGYYRVAVVGDVVRFITRRGGRATLTLASGAAHALTASEETVVRGVDSPVVETYVAPELDAWDRWNYARTDYEIEALSARYVSPGVYGVGVLDQWGAWRVVPDYGAVWVPRSVPAGWAPYTTGSWVWDPYYGWTWVDDAPWGWAPFHYGRWVLVSGFWAWAPGPVMLRPVYAPALVAFFAFPSGVSVSVALTGPAYAWVALGWGEPLLPWWGPPGFIGRPWWRGWAGPRVVNNVVIERTTVVNVQTIVYQHTKTPRALVAVPDRQFGGGPVKATRLPALPARELQPIAGAHPVAPVPRSLVPREGIAPRAPAQPSAPVLATRPPREAPLSLKSPRVVAPPPRVIAPPPRPAQPDIPAPRPSFATKGAERQPPPEPPRYSGVPKAPAQATQRPGAQAERRALPGSPANVRRSSERDRAPATAKGSRGRP